MSAPDQSREPCPDRILDDIGGAFGMGAVGGSVFHFLKGMKNSPNGERLLGGSQAVRMNAPRVGGSFAVWGGLFSVFDCSMVYVRQKEDPWNSIFAGAATGGFLQMRHGMRSASRSAMFGGVLLALIEGAGLMINRVLASMPPPPIEQPMGLPTSVPAGAYGGIPGVPNTVPGLASASEDASTSESGWKSWTGGWFGGKKEEAVPPTSSGHEGMMPSLSAANTNEGFSAATMTRSSKDSGSTGKTGWPSWFGGEKDDSTAPAVPAGEKLGSFETSSGPAIPTFDYK